jgi:protein SCO1/2
MGVALSRRQLLAAGLKVTLASAATCPAARAAGTDFRVERQVTPALPDVPLVTMRRQATTLQRELDVDEPLWLNFVFTTCSTTCSMQTAVLAALQARLAREGRAARFLSLTIDPDNDTPEQLARFAARFGIDGAGSTWRLCTGRFDDLLAPQRAFDVYRGSKAAHPPVLMLRTARRASWWRIAGFPLADDLHAVLRDKLRAG